jgi:hypothetical protein
VKTASLNDLKNELSSQKPDEILTLCLRLAKYKKDNKELLTYLLFEANDEQGYIESIKKEIDLQLEGINKNNVYYIKKSLRKTLRIANKYIKYSASKQTELEVLIYFCTKLKNSELPIQTNNILNNLYQRQLERIKKALSTLHEDLQYDYKEDIDSLS